MEVGTDGGALTTFTEHFSRCADCGPPARATAKRTSSAPENGCARFRTQTEAGGKAAPVTRIIRSSRRRPRRRKRLWAILGLLAGGDTTSNSLHKGIEYLIEMQRADGGWDEELSTGTGFPGVFYLKYHLYRNSFPVLAMSSYLKTR